MRVLHSLKNERRTIRKKKARGSHPNRKRRMMERRATNQRRIGLPTKLAICVVKRSTVSNNVQKGPPKMTATHLSRVTLERKFFHQEKHQAT